VFHSHNFLRQMSDLGVPLLAVGPGTNTMHTKKTTAAGITSPMTAMSHVGIVSWFSWGKDMERSTGEKGRLKGVRYSHPAPTAAIALIGGQPWWSCCALNDVLVWLYGGRPRVCEALDLHDDDPVKDVRQNESYRGHA
jgi:hypothetical protein